MGCAAQLAPTLLLHVNLLLMVYAGAALVVAARARWDPSLYIPARELFPREYRAAAALLPAAAFTLLALAHTVLLALRTRRLALRRLLLYLYAAGVSLMLVVQTAAGAWGWARLHAWARSAAAHELQHAAALGDVLRPLLAHLAHWHPLPDKLNELIEEAETDLPNNLPIMAAMCGVLVALELLAALLALASAMATPRAQPRSHSYSSLSCVTTSTPLSLRKGEDGRSKPRAVYKNGRLVLVDKRPADHTHEIIIHRTLGQL